MEPEREIAKYFYELGQLKRVKRSGWWLAGIKDPESVAEHTFRTAAIAYVLAILEGANPEKAAALALFHDTAETRVNDLHRLGKKYVDWSGVEERVAEDQCELLPSAVAESIRSLLREYGSCDTLESQVAHDADRLECLVQGREYEQQGASAREWIQHSRTALKTSAARRLAAESLNLDAESWR